jgi:hypothetical protein
MIIRWSNNETTQIGGEIGLSTPIGIRAGVSNQNKHDHGKRVVLFSRKCGETKGHLGQQRDTGGKMTLRKAVVVLCLEHM